MKPGEEPDAPGGRVPVLALAWLAASSALVSFACRLFRDGAIHPFSGGPYETALLFLSTVAAPCLMLGALASPDRAVLRLLHWHLGLYAGWYAAHLAQPAPMYVAAVADVDRALVSVILGALVPFEGAVAAVATAWAARRGVPFPEWRWLAPGVAVAFGGGWLLGSLPWRGWGA